MNVPSKNGDPLTVPSLFLAPPVFGNRFSGLQIIVDGVETSVLDLSSSSVKNVAVDQNPHAAEFGRSGKGRLEVMMCKTARRRCKISCRSLNFPPILPVPTFLSIPSLFRTSATAQILTSNPELRQARRRPSSLPRARLVFDRALAPHNPPKVPQAAPTHRRLRR